MRKLFIFFLFFVAKTALTAQKTVETIVFTKCNCEKRFIYSTLKESGIDVIKATKTGLETVFILHQKKVFLDGAQVQIDEITEDADATHVYFLDFHFVLRRTEGGILETHEVL